MEDVLVICDLCLLEGVTSYRSNITRLGCGTD